MSRRVIDRKEWPAFVDAFSRRHGGWLVSLAVEKRDDRSYLWHDVPLRGVVAEIDARHGSMMIFTGDTAPHSTHFIERPVALSVDDTEEGAEAELTVTDESGAQTIVEFRSPMRPELVDGIV